MGPDAFRKLPGPMVQGDSRHIVRCPIIEKTAQPGTGFQEDDTKPLIRCRQGGPDAGRTATNDTEVRIDVLLIKLSFKN